MFSTTAILVQSFIVTARCERTYDVLLLWVPVPALRFPSFSGFRPASGGRLGPEPGIEDSHEEDGDDRRLRCCSRGLHRPGGAVARGSRRTPGVRARRARGAG